MKFGGICIETDNAPRLAEFYKIVFQEEPFIEGGHYAFGSVAVYNPGDVTVAKAKEEFEGTDIYGIFLRCDYRMITDEKIEPTCFLMDMLKPLPLENQEFILKLHQKYFDDGFQCTVSIVDDTCIRFYYLYKRKEIWSIIIYIINAVIENHIPLITSHMLSVPITPLCLKSPPLVMRRNI